MAQTQLKKIWFSCHLLRVWCLLGWTTCICNDTELEKTRNVCCPLLLTNEACKVRVDFQLTDFSEICNVYVHWFVLFLMVRKALTDPCTGNQTWWLTLVVLVILKDGPLSRLILVIHVLRGASSSVGNLWKDTWDKPRHFFFLFLCVEFLQWGIQQ